MTRQYAKGFFARLFQAFRSNCGDNDVWADLSPWELCATSFVEIPQQEIPRVVSIAEEGSGIISDIYDNRHFSGKQSRTSSGHTAETESEAEPSAVFAIKRRRKKKEAKHKGRESPPSHHSRRRSSSTSPSREAQRRFHKSLLRETSPERRKLPEKGPAGIPQSIYVRPKVQHHIVRL
jgi:hypothetical protein